MHAGVTILQLQPGKTDELLHIFAHSVMPVVHQQEGFKFITLLTDRLTNRVLSIGLWETEADLLASEDNGLYCEQLAKVGALLTAPPTREVYEVSVQVAPI